MASDFTIYKSDGTDILADVAVGEPAQLNRISRGDSVTFQFRNLATRLSVPSGASETIASSETRRIDFVDVSGALVVDGRLECDELSVDGGTVDVNGTLSVNERVALELADLRKYREYSGEYTLHDTLDATKKFTEQIDETVLNSLVIGIEPTGELKNNGIPGVWGVLDEIVDARSAPLVDSSVTVEMTVLAPFDEYSSVTDVTSALKI
jgi:hypothetical protein